MIELIASILLVVYGSMKHYCIFEEISIDKQHNDKKVKNMTRSLTAPLASKGGVINYFCEDHIGKLK